MMRKKNFVWRIHEGGWWTSVTSHETASCKGRISHWCMQPTSI